MSHDSALHRSFSVKSYSTLMMKYFRVMPDVVRCNPRRRLVVDMLFVQTFSDARTRQMP